VRTRFVRLFHSLSLLLLGFPTPSSGAPIDMTGVVADSTGQPLSRALVTVKIDDQIVATTFADDHGAFRIHADVKGKCLVEASLTGFKPAVAPCSTESIRLALPVAPIQESIVVTATRGETPSGQLAASVTVFDREDLERRQMPPVADLLRTAVGTTVVRTGGYGNVTSLFVRGGESNYTKVLLDGIPLNEPGGTFNFSNVTSEHLERIELVRGAQSALFGSDAMAGVVQMFTERAQGDATRVAMMAEGGSFDSGRASISVGSARGKFDYSVGAAHLVTDNEVANNEFDNTTLSGTAGVQLAPAATLRFVARTEFGRVGTPGATAFGRPDLDAFFDRHDGVVGATYSQDVNASFRQRATYAIAFSDYESTNLVEDPPYTPAFDGSLGQFEFSDFLFDSHTDQRRHHAAYQADWRLGGRAGQLITAVIDWDGERTTLSDRLAASEVKASRDNFGVSVQHQALWDRTFVTLGLRLEHNDSFGGAVVPRLSVAYIARQASGEVGQTKLKAAYGGGIKEPTIVQSFSPNPGFLGNPDLEPEESRSFETGVEQRLFDDRAKLELTWFYNRFKNIISTRTISFAPFTSQYFNIGLTRARGAELTLETAPAPSLRTTVGYTFLDSEILESTAPTNPVFAEGQWLFRRPRHSGFAEIVWSWRALTLDGIGTFVGRRVESDFVLLDPPIQVNDGYARWDLRASYRITPLFSILGAIDNLGDADYMEPLGFPALGRAARGGVRVTF
jgi:vitamin B12 transporter